MYRLDHVFWILIMTCLHGGYDGFYHPTFSASLNYRRNTHIKYYSAHRIFRSGSSKIIFCLIGYYRIFGRFVPSVKPTKEALAHLRVCALGGKKLHLTITLE